jgi:hypothetical protein
MFNLHHPFPLHLRHMGAERLFPLRLISVVLHIRDGLEWECQPRPQLIRGAEEEGLVLQPDLLMLQRLLLYLLPVDLGVRPKEVHSK